MRKRPGKNRMTCETCGNEMFAWNYELKRKKFCSHKCFRHTEVTNDKNKQSHVGNKAAEEKKKAT